MCVWWSSSPAVVKNCCLCIGKIEPKSCARLTLRLYGNEYKILILAQQEIVRAVK